MFCDKCGLAIPDKSVNCPYCGKPTASTQQEILQTPYYKSPPGLKINSSYERGDYFNLNVYIKNSMPLDPDTAPATSVLSEAASDAEDKKIAEATSNRPLYIAIIAMITFIVIAIISLILRLTVLKPLESRLETTSTVTSSCIIEEADHANKL